MVDTFSCDSCGKHNVPTDDKRVLQIKSVIDTGKKTQKGKPQKASVTQAMEVCPDCVTEGVYRNHTKVSPDGEKDRHFTWNPRKDLENTYEWGQSKAQSGTQGTS